MTEVADTIRQQRRAMVWLLAALVLAVSPHFSRQPKWVSVCFLMLAGWKLMGVLRHWPLPGPRYRLLNLLKQALAISLFAGIYSLYGGSLGRETGVSMLIVLLGLKMIEMRRDREFFLACFLGYFLIITDFFYSQTIGTAGFMLLAVLMLTTSLVTFIDRGGSMAVLPRLRIAATLVAQALPLMLIAFLLFPRVSGPLWGMPKDAYAGLSGLSDVMAPGTISQLSLSDDPAFRVEFKGDIPPQKELYWRGPVLSHTDGFLWTRGSTGNLPPPQIKPVGKGYEYTVTLEPHNHRWLYLLDLPTTIPADATETRDLRVVLDKPLTQRYRYSAVSYPVAHINQYDKRELDEDLQLPPNAHPRTVALAREWRRHYKNDLDLANHALDYFRHQNFYYTLTPPLPNGDSVDAFMFDTHRGFCEHYAAAFTVLMRAAGIPARVVTGYQGGEYNSVGGYLLVRQRDAHAWSEIWLNDRGWMRVDPTAAVAPNRIERGIDQVLPQPTAGIARVLEQNLAVQETWKRLREAIDAINNRWNQWVLGYNNHRQVDLMARFGLDADWNKLAFWLLGMAGLVFALIGAGMVYEGRRHGDPVQRAYERFCRKLAAAGVSPRRGYEGPFDFARRAARNKPRLASDIERITGLYVSLRYGPTRPHNAGQTMTQAVNAFRVASNRRRGR